VRKLINGPSVSSIQAIAATTAATITVELPSDVGLSAPPLSGNFRIKCVSPDGTISYSDDIGISTDKNWIN